MSTPTVFESPFQVNTGTAATGGQSEPQIVGLADGGFVVVWTEDAAGLVGTSPGTDIVAKIYDAEGNVVVDSFQLNTTFFADDEGDFDITATATGFAIAYTDDSIAGTSTQIIYQSYDLTGSPIAGSFLAFTPGGSGDRYDNPQIAANLTASNDDIYVAYDDDDGIDEDITAIVIDETGAAGSPFSSAQNSSDFDRLGDVAVLSNGNYVTVYVEDDSISPGGSQGIEFAIRDETGTSIVFGSNVTAFGIVASEPQVASLAGGGFVVVYTVGQDIRAVVYDNGGIVVVPEFTVAGGLNTQNEPHVVGLPDGKFVVIWDDDTTGNLTGQSYNADGSLDGTNFVIASSLNIFEPDISVTADGRILVTYSVIGGEIFTAIYDPRDVTINPDDYATETTNFLTTDTITTSKSGSNVLASTTGAKTILGQEGNDTIRSSGLDTIFGGAGDDLIFAGLGLPESLDGGIGNDTLDTTTFSGNYRVDLASGLTNFGGELFTNFENLISGSGDDTLLGTNGDNMIRGNFGDDSIVGLNGDDTIDGGDGNDTIIGGAGADLIDGSIGSNVIFGDDGNDTIRANGFDTVDGGAGQDLVFATAGLLQILNGGGGLDTLNTTSFAGNYVVDLATGLTNIAGEVFFNFENIVLGIGDDEAFGTANTNAMSGGDGNDRLLGFGGNDTINGQGGNDTLNGGDGNDQIDGGAGADSVFAGAGDDTVEGGAGDDLLEGQLGRDFLFGDAGNDTLRGADGNDRIDAGDGDDVAFGGNDSDTLNGGDGNDTLDGSGGNDSIDGGAGNDVLVGETGEDTISGSIGNDTIRGGGGNDDINGGQGDDVIFGSSGEDVIFGSEGNDLLEGNQQADALLGEAGNDTLRGGDGFDFLSGGFDNDTLAGGNGNDTLSGDGGVDVLRGNAQNDTFEFNFVSDSSFGASDLIDGIEGVGVAGGDVIDVASIDADATTAGDDAFNFIGQSTAAAAIGLGAGTLWVENNGGQTLLRGIVDNDAVIDFEVRIADGAVVAGDYIAGDFIL